MENNNYLTNYAAISDDELQNINGGLALTIMGVTFVGWKAAALIAAGITTLGGAAGLGIWNGYHDTKK